MNTHTIKNTNKTNKDNINIKSKNIELNKNNIKVYFYISTNQNFSKINTFNKRIKIFINDDILAKSFCEAALARCNNFCMNGMQKFAYQVCARNTIRVGPVNIKGGIMKFKANKVTKPTILVLSILAMPNFAENNPEKASENSQKITYENANFDPSWKPYIGASTGYGRLSAKNNWSDINPISGTDTGKNNFNCKGLLGQLYVGIQKSLTENVRFGGEVYGFFDTHKASVDGTGRSESLKRENGAGLKAKLAYVFDTHTAIYAHGGIEKAGFKYTISGSRGKANAKKYLWGMPFGLGVETSLGSKWDARIEYTHTLYQKWNTGSKDIGASSISTAKISSSQDSVLLGLSYKF